MHTVPRVVLVDHHDSYAFNLAALCEAAGATVRVIPHDSPALLSLGRHEVDALVLSPGPGSPLVASDVGHTPALLARMPDLPVLGVCLGHQLLASLAGAAVREIEPSHGHVEAVTHDGSALFDGMPSPFRATRYHSLAILPEGDVEATAWAPDGTVMAMAVRGRPWWGVQFHPESVASEAGLELVRNFLAAVPRRPEAGAVGSMPTGSTPTGPIPAGPTRAEATVAAERRRVAGPFDRAAVFRLLYADEPASFWLDSPVAVMGAASAVVTLAPDEVWPWLAALPSYGADALPGGWVGCLSYEEEGRWLRADRVVRIDQAGDVLLEAVGPGAADWLEATSNTLSSALPTCCDTQVVERTTCYSGAAADTPEPAHRDYLRKIAVCKEHLAHGESYELCLTRQIHLPPIDEPLALFEELRRTSPTDRMAYLRFGDLAVASATPEEFVSLTADGVVRARPIKGTARRSPDPTEDAALAAQLGTDPKTRAENLMIVDLLRNDLHRVCDEVAVPGYLEVESYATVHQLVSTVTGRLRPDATRADLLRSTFPPGSMTGAPKERTVALLEALEDEPRGLYAGALGVLGADGSLDLSVVIRTAVCTPDEVTIGVGGAIVWASDPEAEWQETELKAQALLRAYAAVTSSEP